MNTYTEGVPSLQPVAGVFFTAPAVLAGAPLDGTNIFWAIAELVYRYRVFRQSDNTAVTGVDIVVATVRMVHIVQQHLAGMHADAPPWAIALQQAIAALQRDQRLDLQQAIADQQRDLQQAEQRIGQTVQQAITALQRDQRRDLQQAIADQQRDLQQAEQRIGQTVQQAIAALQRDQRLDLQQAIADQQRDLQQAEQRIGQTVLQAEQRMGQTVQTQLQPLQNDLTLTRTQLHNILATAYNARAIKRDAITREHHNFHRFMKSTPGPGNGLPGAPAPPGPLPLLQVSEIVPQEFFPENYEALTTWTHQQISVLSILLNEDFGIVRADTVGVRRLKLQSFLARSALG